MAESRSGSPYHGLVTDYGGVLTTSIAASMGAFCLQSGVSPERLAAILGDAYLSPSPPRFLHADPEVTGRPETEAEPSPGSLGHLIVDLETGRLPPDEFEAELAAALSDGLSRPLVRAGLIDRLFATVTVDDRMLQAVRSTRGRGVKAAVLSNTWGRSVFHPEMLDLFDAVVLSEREGMRKPEPEIYLLAAERLQLRPDQCVFVDDLLANVEGARAVGMAGVLHKHPDITIPKLEQLLGITLS